MLEKKPISWLCPQVMITVVPALLCKRLVVGGRVVRSIVTSRLEIRAVSVSAQIRFTAYFWILYTTLISLGNNQLMVSFLLNRPRIRASILLHSLFTYSTLSGVECATFVKAPSHLSYCFIWNEPLICGLNLSWAVIPLIKLIQKAISEIHVL